MKATNSLLKIKQFNPEGNFIQIYQTVKEASQKTGTREDSIILCCKGKHQTSNGFVFRFEKDDFNTFKVKKRKGQPVKCKICGSDETFLSIPMHLRWMHKGMKVDDYVKEHGEYVPRRIKVRNKKDKSIIKCEICNEEMMHNRQLMYHITKKHKGISKEEYVVKYIYANHPPLCKCGCGGEVKIRTHGKNEKQELSFQNSYIKGHWDWPVFSNISNQSKEELDLIAFIKTIYGGEIQESVKNLLPKGEIDIYLPSLNLAIEYNGLYWHSEKSGRGQYYHLYKTLECKKKGIRLIHIFSDEWINKQDIVKSKLQSIIGTNSNKIYARKCIITEIKDTKIKNEFLSKYHIQGSDKSKIKLGLYYNNELVSLMTFSNPRLALGAKSSITKWELSRFASSCHVIGGASKLIKHFIKNYNPESIYSYSDNRWSDWENNMYLKTGFDFISRSTPGYYYTKDYITRFHRFNFRKQKLKEMGVNIEGRTENKIMNDLGYVRIWDCGVAKFEYKNLSYLKKDVILQS